MNRQQYRTVLLILSFLLMSVTFAYISPIVMITGLTKGVIAAGLIFWIALFLLTFVFGRIFCSHLCLTGGEQMIIDRAVNIRLRRVPYLRYLKYLLAFLWVGGAVLLAAGAGSLVVNPLFGAGTGLPPWPAGAYAMFSGITIMVLAIAILLGKRGMCYYFCPMSVVFMAITTLKNRLRLPSLHLEADPDDCIRCKKCERACPMSLPVQEMVEKGSLHNPECILCASCIGACPKGVLRYSWSWKT